MHHRSLITDHQFSMQYNAKTIRHLTKLIQGDEASYDWLRSHNFPELIQFYYAINGNEDALNKLVKSKHVEIAAFTQAILDDKQAFNALAKNKKYTWAATVKVVYRDAKAEAWLMRYDLAHFAELGRALRKNLEAESGENALGMMKKFMKVLARPFRK